MLTAGRRGLGGFRSEKVDPVCKGALMTSSTVVRRVSSLTFVLAPAIALVLAAGCSGGGITEGAGGSTSGGTTGNGGTNTSGGTTGPGGTTAKGGTTGTGGTTTSGGTTGNGGTIGSGGSTAKGGTTGTGGSAANGGTTGTGATTSSGSTASSGGITGSGGTTGTGGATARGGTSGAGGVTGRGGVTGTGGQTGAGGTGAGGSTTDGGTPAMDCTTIPAMPTGGTSHSGNSQGGTGNLAWQIWSNQGSGTLTTFSTPAFSAAWNNSGDYLGRLGFEWGNNSKAYTAYGTITAQLAFKKTGSAGGFSYIGIYGWSTNPCVEYYIIDDSFGTMPFNAYNATLKGTVSIDGENYKLFQNNTTGTGGSRCSGVSSWLQFWSIRQKARQCGQISITQHFDAWKAAGMTLGNMLEAKILVETGGGSGSVDFPIANVAAK
jgi:hypothetical protein